MSTPVAGSLSVTPLYASAADVLVLWDDVNATWRSLPSVSAPMSVGQGGTGQTALTASAVLVGNGTGPITASAITSDNGAVLRVSTSAVVGNAFASPPANALVINGNTASPSAALAPGAGTALASYAADGASNIVSISAPGQPILQTNSYGGTLAAPAALVQTDYLGQWQARGYDGAVLGSGARLAARATEAWTATHHGTAFAFSTVTNSTTALNEVMRIDHNGNVGIGTAAPSEALQIHGNIRFDRSDASFIPFVIGTDGGGLFFTEYSGTTAQHTPLYLAAGGHVGIGTATPGTMLTVVALPGAGDPVNVVADGNREARITFSATSTRQWAAGCDGQFYSGGFVIADNTAAATRLLINTAGACFNTTGTWATLSDASVKENVTPYTRGLDAIVALNPVQFRYAAGTPFADLDKPSRQLFGLIADDVKPHVPEVVGTTTATVGKKEGVELSTLEPGNLIYALINAVKELKSELDALKGDGVPAARRAR